jgi:N-acetyl-D-muramate 6-phosphate phosphatase
MTHAITAMLFDLDGTLIDSADDLANAMNAVRADRGEPPVPLARLRPHTARGASSMIAEAYGYDMQHPEYPALRNRFLEHYARALLVHTKIWPGMSEVLASLDRTRTPWGIVTNKAAQFAEVVVAGLGLAPAVLVSGDSTAQRKPHPEPLFFAAKALNVPTPQIAYVGDAVTDMQAARAAGMLAVGAGYSHFVEGFDRAAWNADVWVDSPAALLSLVRAAA